MRPDGPPPVKCARHDVYHNKDAGCWKCKREGEQEVVQSMADQQQQAVEQAMAGATHPDLGDPDVPPLRMTGEVEVVQIDALASLPPPCRGLLKELVEMDAPNAAEILYECLHLAAFLANKNKAYGDSALNPVRILSTSGPSEQIRIRMDDKLSRLVRGEAAGEDAILDLVGYYILLKIAERKEQA